MLKQGRIIESAFLLFSLNSIAYTSPNFPTKIEAIIFDCDGVLINRAGVVAAATAGMQVYAVPN